jgi:hypothetical protein
MDPLKDLDSAINSTLEAYIEKLEDALDFLEREEDRVMDALYEAKARLKESPKIPQTSKNNNHAKISAEEIKYLDSASSGEIFLWGLEKRGGEGTASEIADQVNHLPIDRVKQRDLSALKQWLTVTGNLLYKDKMVDKIKRKDRKGGIMFKKK